MALTKAERAALRAKFDGCCAYCGSPLPDRWHADHIEPVVRNDWFKRAGFPAETHRPPDHPERDTVENMNPACPPCNIDKHSLSLEHWRELMQRSNEVLMRDVSTFRRAVRYGLVELKSEPIVFHFEKLQRAAAQQGTTP